MEKYQFIADAGHGWLEVPAAEVAAAGIAADVSRYSYQSADGATVYLEEDCDAGRFGAVKAAAADQSITDWFRDCTSFQHIDGDCFIRKLPRYGGAVRIVAQSPSARVADTDSDTAGSHDCGRCAHTGRFITGSVNGKPTGPGGSCYRCNGKGYHTQKDRRRNMYFDAHRPVYL